MRKIEIDLDDILGDEQGVETLSDSINRQVRESIIREIKSGIKTKIDEEVHKEIEKSIKESLKEITPNFINNLLESEYIITDKYGDRDKKTTFRSQILKSLKEEMVYKKCSYKSDENYFTKAVDSIVEKELNTFKKDFTDIVTKEVSQKTIDFAVSEIKKKLNL